MISLPRNEKQTHRLNSRPLMWPLDLTLAVTLTLTFQGQIWNLLYLNQKFSRSYVILTILWPRSGVRIYQIVTGVTSDVGVPSTHLVLLIHFLPLSHSHIHNLTTHTHNTPTAATNTTTTTSTTTTGTKMTSDGLAIQSSTQCKCYWWNTYIYMYISISHEFYTWFVFYLLHMLSCNSIIGPVSVKQTWMIWENTLLCSS